MKPLLIAAMIVLSTPVYSSGFGSNPISQRHAEQAIEAERRFNQNLIRELRETGKIAPKSYTDVYNMREGGYGYDGSHIDNHKQYSNPYRYGY